MLIWLDLETYSECDLAKCGAHRYAEDPTTEVTLFGYAIDDAPAKVWDRTATKVPPADLTAACADPAAVFIAHNSAFDRSVLAAKVSPLFGDVGRWQDTMIKAYSVSLPGSLGKLSEVLGLPQDKAKDKDGRRLVLKFCKPSAAGVRKDRTTDPDDWARFVEYCRLDVEAMRETAKRIPAWNMTPAAWDDWRIDQRINDRGICLDSDLIAAAVSAAERAKAAGNDKVSELTDGAVRTAGQRDELLRFILDAYGVTLPDMRKSTLERCLDDDALPEGVRELIALRLQSAKASVQKFLALDRAACADGRLRGTMQYMGASRTGRWAGRIFQPQNLPRGSMKPGQVETAIRALKSGSAEYLYDDVNAVISNCIRGAVCAPDGKKLVVADLSNIEGRMLAWLAGEEWKLEAFRAFDRGEGPDIYKATYAKTFGIRPEDVTKTQRQIGKVLELALGYEGGVGAFITFAVPYRVDLDALADLTFASLDPYWIKKASSFWDFAVEKKITHGLKRETFIACDAIKRAWRDRHPKIVQLWRDLGEAAVAIASGATDRVDINERVSVVSPYRGWMTIVLPSGRGVCYPDVKLANDGHADAVTYAGINQRTRQWGPLKTYSGKLAENLTQSAARDVLMRGIANAEGAGYAVVMHVHDEIIAEVPDSPEYTAEGLAACMTSMPAWADGLPLAAAGFEAHRYRKE
jgi:DNA polymerase